MMVELSDGEVETWKEFDRKDTHLELGNGYMALSCINPIIIYLVK